jgi:hypothetical protein
MALLLLPKDRCMFAPLRLILCLLMICFNTYAQVEETTVSFKVSPKIIATGEIQMAFAWLNAGEFAQLDMAVMDQPGIHLMHPHNLKMVVSKLAFLTTQTFEDLAYANLNQADYIQDMLGALVIDQLSSDSWYLTNRVKAYKLPFRLGYELQTREVEATRLRKELVQYFRKEAADFPGTGRERFISLDMHQFTQLIYRNYSVCYMKELRDGRMLIISGVIAGININRANFFFNYPPFSRTETKMLGNMREQVLVMARKIQSK